MTQCIAYTRVSTREQKRSGLGLAAQRQAIADYARNAGYEIAETFEDVQTGKGADAEELRPGLRAALAKSEAIKAPLIVSKLDRLSRDSHYIGGLMKRKVRFIVTAFPEADAFTLQIHAAVAEQEARLISERTKAGLAKSSKRLGMRNKTKAVQRTILRKAAAATRAAASERREALCLHLHVADALAEGRTLRAAAAWLNARKIATPRACSWSATQLLRTARRLGLRAA